MPPIVDRETNLIEYAEIKPKKIIVITGFRRVGKTYLIFQLINELLKEGSREEIAYFNFEDERIPLKTEFLTTLLPVTKQNSSRELEFLFLDEIQNIPDWSRWLRRVYDNEDTRIFVTGSSSKLSSKEIPTELRGRFLEIKLFPLSFKEFLKFKDINVDLKTVAYSENEKAKLFRALDEYLRYGSMPEVVLTSNGRKTELLHSYYNTVTRRDIIERFNVRNEEAMKALLRLLLNSTYYSISKSYKILKGLNYDVGKTTLQHYLNYIENSYLIHSLPIFSFKIKDQLQYPRKIYFADHGFINALSTKFSKDRGRLYENVVFMELKRRTSRDPRLDLFYWRNQKQEEVDFVLKENHRVKELVQVCYDVSDYDTKRRETKALLKAMDEFKLKRGLIITEDHEGGEEFKGKIIKYTPLWRWLLK